MSGYQNASPVGRGNVGFKILHSLLLLVVGVLAVQHFGQRLGIGLLIIHNLMVPEGNLGHVAGVFPVFVPIREFQVRNFLDTFDNAVHHLGIIVVVALQHRDAGMFTLVMVQHPHAETGQGGGKGGDPEGQGLQRRISPRFII